MFTNDSSPGSFNVINENPSFLAKHPKKSLELTLSPK